MCRRKKANDEAIVWMFFFLENFSTLGLIKSLSSVELPSVPTTAIHHQEPLDFPTNAFCMRTVSSSALH